MTLELYWQIFFKKNNQISNLIKICPAEAELFHTGGRPDMTKLLVTFRNLVNAPKNGYTSSNTCVCVCVCVCVSAWAWSDGVIFL